MADNLPNDDDMATEIHLISQDHVVDDLVIAEVVKDSTKNVSRIVTRGFSNRFFSLDISHGVNFDVTGNDDSIKDSSTDDDDFIQVVTKKRKVKTSMISALDKRAFNQKIDALVKKNEKSRTAKDTVDFSLKQGNKNVRRLEADLRLLNKKFCKADAQISDFKSEETRLILSNKTLKKAA